MSIPNIQFSGNPIQKTVVKGGNDIKDVSVAIAKQLMERRKRKSHEKKRIKYKDRIKVEVFTFKLAHFPACLQITVLLLVGYQQSTLRQHV